MGSKKKLHLFSPKDKKTPDIETHRTAEKVRIEPADDKSIERNVRQLLSDKVSGNLVGTWMLIPEHLKLGTWDLLRSWTEKPTSHVEPRLAMQLVNEAALCITGIRQKRTLSQKGFELANGLHFVATDTAIHHLLDGHTVNEAQNLQVILAKIRLTLGDFDGSLPKRWHIEEFFKNYQDLGWNRAGTMNLNVQYGRMTMALIAQAATHHMRRKIGAPFDTWDAKHFANDFIRGIEGDVRVKYDTIIVTLYNPPNPQLLKKHYENLPEKLIAQGIDPKVPWLYDLKIDFRIK